MTTPEADKTQAYLEARKALDRADGSVAWSGWVFDPASLAYVRFGADGIVDRVTLLDVMSLEPWRR